MANETLGWVGAGKMGGPMSRRLVETQHRVMVFEPDEQNRSAVVEAGALVAPDLAAIGTEARIVFSMIPNDVVLRQIVLGTGGLAETMARGSVLVEMSTVSPAASKQVAEVLAARGIDYLRAPVSGSTALAKAGTLSVMASGPRAAYDRVEPLLAAMSAKRFYLGDAEQARYLKLVVNSLVGATSSLLAEALAFGRKGDLSLADMLDVIGQSAVASPLIGYKRDMVVSGDYAPAFTVEQMIKDFDLIMDTARTDHVPMMMAALVRQQYEQAFADGDGQRDFFVLCESEAERGRRAATQ
ncbi:NAD(P)-dependent oxidoreductase [Lichenifustis flavocetrariae]|uniref:NAD(P)-dependent oxidoreductase n=1 Tax=Lichenifustis flavocetrariae TaxID=2949735 RepID=A0AA42CKH9_9HYPH|nr:NAD(P)-dependent oxidoreductase [Lichenifustis flavocetrariae]MCW6509271.1 NAD(P)-dependent oxidoreductase [Lichenifustis flavocetrariae]